jgi:RimJ/RimL family protein N-acetyltransferase
VTLRPWRESDVAQFRDACQDNSVSRWTGFPFDLTETETVNLVRERIAAARDRTGAAFAVVGADDRLLGSAGLFQIDWHRSFGVVAYWLAPWSRGNGIGSRAVSALCEWAFRSLQLARLELRVDVRNEPSQRLAERVGFRREGIVRSSQEIHGERINEFLYSLLPADARPVDHS